jgi:hypothetical protein
MSAKIKKQKTMMSMLDGARLHAERRGNAKLSKHQGLPLIWGGPANSARGWEGFAKARS